MSVSQWGEYRFAHGLEEMLQKAILCAKIRKGSFVYNKNLGTELSSVDAESPNATKTATMLLNEALIGEKGFKAEVLSIDKTNDGKLKMLVSVKNEEETKSKEVTINADL